MVDIQKMTIKEINDYCKLQLQIDDLRYILDRKISKNEWDKLKDPNMDSQKVDKKIIEFLEKNETYVDKEKLILINLDYYQELEKMRKENVAGLILDEYGLTEKMVETGLKRARECAEFCKDKDIKFVVQKQSNKEYKRKVKVISSKQLLEGQPSKEEKKKEKATKKGMKILSDEAVLNALIEANHAKPEMEFFDVPGLGETLLETIVYNSSENLDISRQKIDKIIENKELGKLLTNRLVRLDQREIKTAFETVGEYVDINKMSLYALACIIESIENANLIYVTREKGSTIVKRYADYSGDNMQLFPYMERFLGEYFSVISQTDTEVSIDGKKYTTEEAKENMKKYIHGRYMSLFSMEDQIAVFLERGIEPTGIHKSQLEYIKQYILEQRGVKSLKELNQMLDVHLLDDKGVLKLYEDRRMSLKNIREMRERLHLEKEITPKFMLNKVEALQNIPLEERQFEEQILHRYVDLYKELYINGKSEEDIIQAGEELINELEKNQKTESVKQEDILHYGLLSEKTYAKLADRGIISMDNLMQAYQKGQIDIHTMAELKKEGNSFTDLDIEQYIIDSYMKIREQKSPDETELKKYIALYKALRLNGLSEEERNEVANEFIMRTEERGEDDIENGKQRKAFGEEDRRNLYQLEAIPIDTVVLWGEQDEVIHLLKSGDIVAKDVKRLYQNRSLILHDFQNLMKAKDMELEQKINLVNIVFSTPEDAKIREDLFENITELETTVNGNSSNKKQKTNEIGVEETENDETKATEGARNRYLFDTAVRYNAWIASDEDVKMTTFKDGHLAVQLPNVKDGIVVIEQFYCLKKAQNGKKKMTDKYGANGYVLTKDEYETYKDRFITNNRLSRSELIDLMRELPNLEDRGIGRELRHTKHQYTKNVQKLLGIPEDLAKARTETQRQKALKRLEDSEEYTAEEKDKIRNTHMMWEEVRKSRELYEER